mmetsp:Transcript_42078/g.103128  ORF Transcript_42078/g.103128 Transcript_42078/m.103128 type:complete len:336 (+) Transcript_42078:2604-3611(+)
MSVSPEFSPCPRKVPFMDAGVSCTHAGFRYVIRPMGVCLVRSSGHTHCGPTVSHTRGCEIISTVAAVEMIWKGVVRTEAAVRVRPEKETTYFVMLVCVNRASRSRKCATPSSPVLIRFVLVSNAAETLYSDVAMSPASRAAAGSDGAMSATSTAFDTGWRDALSASTRSERVSSKFMTLGTSSRSIRKEGAACAKMGELRISGTVLPTTRTPTTYVPASPSASLKSGHEARASRPGVTTLGCDTAPSSTTSACRPARPTARLARASARKGVGSSAVALGAGSSSRKISRGGGTQRSTRMGTWQRRTTVTSTVTGVTGAFPTTSTLGGSTAKRATR